MRFIDLSSVALNDEVVEQWINDAKKHSTSMLLGCSTHKDRKDYLDKNPFWNKLKKKLKELFGEKCWYSECLIEGDFGDVDHFRPKNKSTDENGNVLLVDGYWWLAYDYHNYRLSCAKCNRSYENGGKNDCFPVKTGTLPAFFPFSNDNNILLDPCNKDDCDLIDCNESGSIVVMSSNPDDANRVKISSDVYNWRAFDKSRKKVRSECSTALERYEMHYDDNCIKEFEYDFRTIKSLIASQSPYSSFARKYIQAKIIGKVYEPVIQNLLQNTP